jgi:hypothetical protein
MIANTMNGFWNVNNKIQKKSLIKHTTMKAPPITAIKQRHVITNFSLL